MVSVIIPAFNSELTIESTILSILNQNYSNLEIIIVNDGSTDNTENICNKLCMMDERIKYYYITNHGVSYARNYGILKSNGKYISFVDSDDIILNDFIYNLVEAIENTNSDLAVCDYLETETFEEIYKLQNCNLKYKIINGKKDIFNMLFNKFSGFLCNKLYKAEIIKNNEIKLDDFIYMCEDLLFNIEYLNFINEAVYVNKKMYCYIIGRSNASRDINKKWFTILNSYSQIEKKGWKSNTFTLNFLLILYEAKYRANVLNLNFNTILNQYNIKFDKLNKEYYKILFDFKINKKKKLKLFLCKRLYFLYKIILTKKYNK